MLTASGRALPFGDLAKCATAAGADAGATIQCANSFARGWRARGHVLLQGRSLLITRPCPGAYDNFALNAEPKHSA
jgi:hypothetical protein